IVVETVVEEDSRARVDTEPQTSEKTLLAGSFSSEETVLHCGAAVVATAAEGKASFTEGAAKLSGEVLDAGLAAGCGVEEVVVERTQAVGVALVKFQVQFKPAQREGLRVEAVIFKRGFEGALGLVIAQTANPERGADAEAAEQAPARVEGDLRVWGKRA